MQEQTVDAARQKTSRRAASWLSHTLPRRDNLDFGPSPRMALLEQTWYWPRYWRWHPGGRCRCTLYRQFEDGLRDATAQDKVRYVRLGRPLRMASSGPVDLIAGYRAVTWRCRSRLSTATSNPKINLLDGTTGADGAITEPLVFWTDLGYEKRIASCLRWVFLVLMKPIRPHIPPTGFAFSVPLLAGSWIATSPRSKCWLAAVAWRGFCFLLPCERSRKPGYPNPPSPRLVCPYSVRSRDCVVLVAAAAAKRLNMSTDTLPLPAVPPLAWIDGEWTLVTGCWVHWAGLGESEPESVCGLGAARSA